MKTLLIAVILTMASVSVYADATLSCKVTGESGDEKIDESITVMIEDSPFIHITIEGSDNVFASFYGQAPKATKNASFDRVVNISNKNNYAIENDYTLTSDGDAAANSQLFPSMSRVAICTRRITPGNA